MTKFDSCDMDISSSNAVLSNTIEMFEKQPSYSTNGYSRRLFSKLKSSPSPQKLRLKSKNKRKLNKSQRKKASAKLDWELEHDMWNMIVLSLEQNLIDKHKLHWINKEIGIRDSSSNIKTIMDRSVLNQQLVVDENGMKTYIKDLINENDNNSSVKIAFKLVPIVESVTLVNTSGETKYTFVQQPANGCKSEKEHIDANNNDVDCMDLEADTTPSDQTSTSFFSESDSYLDCIDKTATNVSCSEWEYSSFCHSIAPGATSSFVLCDMENTPYPRAPKKEKPHVSRTFSGSPIPKFVKKKLIHEPTTNDQQVPPFHLPLIIDIVQDMKANLHMVFQKLVWIEDHCYDLLKQKNNNSTLTGIDFLCDSVRV